MHNSTPRQIADEIARQRGFFVEYEPPGKLADAIQRPLNDPQWATRVLNAYSGTNMEPVRAQKSRRK